MFGFAFYLGGCLVAAVIVSSIWIMLKPVSKRHDMGTLRAMVTLFVVFAAGPYVVTEVVTRLHGDEMEGAIRDGFAHSEIEGDLDYYKILSVRGDRARAIAVGLETEEWGGTDRPIIALTLDRVEGEWRATSFYTVYSDRLNRDNATFPPYR